MYRDECECLLGNTRHYKRLSRDPTPGIQEEISFLVAKGCWELHFPAAPGIARHFLTLRGAAIGFHLGLPRKHNIDESAVPALARKLHFRPPHPTDEENAGRGGDLPHLTA
ncbi:hypothetical protein NDU88_002922 [Pleurodeles waltl]|uniref:Uncharacterized protein n=1 Tax=Pleurodeles waltl TaxID=8319 RepID=A0AAV7T431_PLEWA|nr:hypothetical protein NDU88_002922 [Pleurodeles waltl]